VLEAARASTQPTTRSTQPPPASPFGPSPVVRTDALPGVLYLSDGRIFPGHIYTTRDRPLRLYDRNTRLYRDIPLDVIESIEAHVEWERMEDDWRWKEQGSDVKVFTGRRYPARKTYYTVTLINGIRLTGDIAQPIYVRQSGKVTRFMLHKRQKGRLGTTLGALPYVRKIVFSQREMLHALEQPPSRRQAEPASRSPKRNQPPR